MCGGEGHDDSHRLLRRRRKGKWTREEDERTVVVLTEIRRVVVLRTVEAYRLQIRYGVLTRTLVHAVPLGHNVHVVEHFVRARAGLVYRANHRPAAFGQTFQDRHALMRARAVQTAAAK